MLTVFRKTRRVEAAEVHRARRAQAECEACHGRAHELGQAVRSRRVELGMSQIALAARSRMTQSAISRLEADGAVPTIGVLDRLARALDAELVVGLEPKAA